MVTLPPGYSLLWSGQHEYMQRAKEKLALVVAATLIFLLVYLNFRSVGETLIVMLSLPFALVGGVVFMWALGYNWSVATAIDFITLAGVAAETGVVVLIYLDHAWEARRLAGSSDLAGLYEAIMEGTGGAGALQDDDGDGDHRRPVAHHVGKPDGSERHEADRRADGRRDDLVHPPDAGGNPGGLFPLEGVDAQERSAEPGPGRAGIPEPVGAD